jgi:hypothetical protein
MQLKSRCRYCMRWANIIGCSMGKKEHAQDFVVHFPNSARIEEGIVAGGPHTLEWWRGSRGWSARGFGGGSEIGTGLGQKNGR